MQRQARPRGTQWGTRVIVLLAIAVVGFVAYVYKKAGPPPPPPTPVPVRTFAPSAPAAP